MLLFLDFANRFRRKALFAMSGAFPNCPFDIRAGFACGFVEKTLIVEKNVDFGREQLRCWKFE